MRNSCGSESRKGERKQTESRVLRNGRETRETRWNGSGKARKLKGREAAPEKATVRQSGEEKERKKQRLSSRNRKRSGRKEVDWKGKDRKRKHKVST